MILKGKAFYEEIGDSYLFCLLAGGSYFFNISIGLRVKITNQFLLLK
jgi:hypothetical protein